MELLLILLIFFSIVVVLVSIGATIYYFMYGSQAAKLRRNAKNVQGQQPANLNDLKEERAEKSTTQPSQTANPPVSYPLVIPQPGYVQGPQYMQPGYHKDVFGFTRCNLCNATTFSDALWGSHDCRRHFRHHGGGLFNGLMGSNQYNSGFGYGLATQQPIGIASYPMQTVVQGTATYTSAQTTPNPTFTTQYQPSAPNDGGFKPATAHPSAPEKSATVGDLEGAHKNTSTSSCYEEVKSSAPTNNGLNAKDLEDSRRSV